MKLFWLWGFVSAQKATEIAGTRPQPVIVVDVVKIVVAKGKVISTMYVNAELGRIAV